jgi:hypothetical protein
MRIKFALATEQSSRYSAERLWAKPLGSGQFLIKNSPFFVFGISLGDVVTAKKKGAAFHFQEVARRGGHSTYRVFLNKGLTIRTQSFKERWKSLSELGCKFENANGRWFAVDVPPAADIHRTYRLLEAGEEAGVWTFEEGHCGHQV